jgi:hypothetical protein
MNKNYILAIPTYKRQKIIITKTLFLLFQYNIKPSNIYLFLANEQEKKIYTQTLTNLAVIENILQKSKKHKITQFLQKNTNSIHKYKLFLTKIVNQSIIGKPGLANQRNFIRNYFPEETKIVQMDDDLDFIWTLKLDTNDIKNNKKYTKIEIINLNKFIIYAFKLCEKESCNLWGIYPIDNAYFMRPSISIHLKFIVGPFFGYINNKSNNLFLTVNEKENAERTLKHYNKDKKVLRFNNISITTEYYKVPGGMQNNNNRNLAAQKSANILAKQFPNYVKIFYKGKTKRAELRFRNSTKKINKTIYDNDIKRFLKFNKLKI